ncbi:hypothetical protein [Pontiella sp.]|uniref:hypothetical protein n=1 Tax=Pontiella sp. TaxID=2837462 RepID=UPI003563D957
MDDQDLDGLINLYEYGLNGNPTNGFVDADRPAFGPGAGGLEYVHARRNDDAKLVYRLSLSPSLDYPAWENLGYAAVGTNETGGVYDYVTNLIDTTDRAKFIKLEIERTP